MNQRENTDQLTYNLIRIHEFLVDRIDLRDFCFVLQHKINRRFDYKNLAGEIPNNKSINLVTIAQQTGYLGELVYQLVDYWLNHLNGNPRVLLDEGIHIELSVYRIELLERKESEKADQVLLILKSFVPIDQLKDLYFTPARQTPTSDDSEEPVIPAETPSPEGLAEPNIPPEIKLSLSFIPQNGGLTQIIWDSDVIGRVFSDFKSPFTGETLQLVIKALDAVQWPSHPLNGPQFNQDERDKLVQLGYWENNHVVENIDRQIGQKLYQALIEDRRADVALTSVRNQARAQNLSIAYLLRFHPDLSELAAHPWELLWDNRTALLMGRGMLNTFTRFLDLDEPIGNPAPPGTVLRILAIVPEAGIPDDIRAEERDTRISVWSQLIAAGIVEMEELNPVTPQSLVDRIQNGPSVDIIHFFGHGCYQNGQGYLLFDTSQGGETLLSADRLAALLGRTKLIMLHACQSAMMSDAGLLTGVAPALSVAGIPAVVAMQLTVRISAATRFFSIVYRALARGESLQRGLSLARQALYIEEMDRASWYVPTVTIRTRDTGPFYLVRQVELFTGSTNCKEE